MKALEEYIDYSTLELLPDGVIIYYVKEGAKILYANKKALRIFECEDLNDLRETCQNDYLNFLHPEDYEHLIESIRIQWETGVDLDRHVQYRVYSKKRNVKMVDATSHSIHVPKFGKCIICVLTRMDQEIQYSLDSVDRLTGAMGMGQFVQHCEAFLKTGSVKKEASQYRIAYINIRHFKEYNVEYGTKKGDMVLQSLARIVTKCSGTQVVARISGDQFVSFTKSEGMKDRIQTIIEDFAFEYGKYGMNVKVGIFAVPNSHQNIRTACDYAKIACDSIRNSSESVAIYNEALSRKLALGRYVIQHFEEAMKNRYIQVYYQPVIRTLTGALCGMEALARWIDPVAGFLSPADFISVLEDNRMITKLDLYILDTVCAEMKEAEAKGRKIIPVSFNLSRIDFVDTDIFEEVERITRKYSVPRDLINIEITESMVMGDASLLKEKVDQFRRGGYQVWMDDFGSAYSSLNVLKEFHFDEIKMDMKFLSTLDESSKTIIRSVVRMARELGVQTLAEGVETEEQLNFLREIGCEKVQGYYYSKPVPVQKVLEICDRTGMKVEERGWRIYYDQIGRVDFITDLALSICEYDGENFRVLFANNHFRDIWGSLKVGELQLLYPNIAERDSSFWKKYRTGLSMLKQEGEIQEMDYFVHGCSVRVRSRCLTRYREHTLCQVEIAQFKKLNDDAEQEMVYTVLQGISEMILLFDLEADTVKLISRNAYTPVENNVEMDKMSPEECVNFGAKHYIHKDDRKLFLELFDFSTLEKRLKESKQGFVASYIRTKTTTGAYIWNVHYLVNLPGTKKYVYMFKYAPLRQKGLFERVNHLQDQNLQTVSFNYLWENLMESQTVNFFWKDKNRRFLGANQCFLDTYGFDSVDQILGKTDEDMHWHTVEEPFKSDEEQVLKEGISVHNRVGKCIINGVTYDIMANKEPIYQNGEISGLWGSFTVLENVIEENNGITTLNLIDPITGVMSIRGAMPVILDYMEGWNVRHEDFAVITIDIPRYRNIVEAYGQELANHAMGVIGTILKNCVDVTGNCTSIYAGTFVIYTHYSAKSEIRDLMRKISSQITAVHEVDHCPLTLRPELSVSYASDAADLQDLMWLSMLPSVFHNADEFEQNYQAQNMQKSILDCLPGIVVVFLQDRSGKLRREYTSKKAQAFMGVGEDSDEGLSEIMNYIYSEDRDWAEAKLLESMRAKDGIDITYRVSDKGGKIHWMRHTSSAIQQADGSYRYYVIYTDVTEQKKLEEQRKSTLTERYGEYLKNNFDAGDISQVLSVTEFQSSMLSAISNAFISMHILNLEDYSFMKIFCVDYLDQLLHSFKNGQEALNHVVKSMIMPESQKDAREFFELSNLSERMEGQKLLELDYLGRYTGWCRGLLIPTTYGENGSLKEVLLLVQPIQAEKDKEEDLRKLSETDGLSQLYNHVSGEAYVNEHLKNGVHGMFCVIDIDNFKSINDNYGHVVGDQVIQGIGKCMRETFRGRDILIRVGGDEFAVYAPGLLEQSACEDRMERLRNKIAALRFQDLPLSVSVSLGSVICSEDQSFEQFDQLYQAADALMYEQKREKKENIRGLFTE